MQGKKMISIILLCSLGWISGCASNSSPPEAKQQDLVIDKFVNPMSRNEVIVAVRECESNNLRAVVIYGKRKINGYTTDIVVEVTCAPKF